MFHASRPAAIILLLERKKLSAMTPRKVKAAKAESLGLFGYGRGLPGEIYVALARKGAVEDLANEIIEKWTKLAQRRTKLRRDAAERLSAELGTLASILVWFHVRRNRAPSELVAGAIDLALGVISPYSRQPVASSVVLRRFGLPLVDQIATFLEAAKLDGEADAAGQPLSQKKLAQLLGKAPSTIRAWRQMPQYASRRRYVKAIAPHGGGER